MKTKLLFILLLGLVSCAKEKINDKPPIKYQQIIGSWIAQDKNSYYSSFTFKQNEEYTLVERKNEKEIQGKLKIQGNKIRLENLGLIEIINLDKGNSLSFTLLKKDNRSFYLTKKKE